MSTDWCERAACPASECIECSNHHTRSNDMAVANALTQGRREKILEHLDMQGQANTRELEELCEVKRGALAHLLRDLEREDEITVVVPGSRSGPTEYTRGYGVPPDEQEAEGDSIEQANDMTMDVSITSLITIAEETARALAIVDELRSIGDTGTDAALPIEACGITGLSEHVLTARDELSATLDLLDLEIGRTQRLSGSSQ